MAILNKESIKKFERFGGNIIFDSLENHKDAKREELSPGIYAIMKEGSSKKHDLDAELYIVSDDKIEFPEDSSNMFTGFFAHSIHLDNIDTSNVKNMASMFALCCLAKHIDVSKFNTDCVTDMSSMFRTCVQLEDLDVSSFNTDKCERMDWMFSGLNNLSSLDISKFNMLNVKDADYMFNLTDESKVIN